MNEIECEYYYHKVSGHSLPIAGATATGPQPESIGKPDTPPPDSMGNKTHLFYFMGFAAHLSLCGTLESGSDMDYSGRREALRAFIQLSLG